MTFEYKCVGGPERPKRLRGTRSRSERVAVAMQEIISAEAVDGWEYLRTELVPVEEKPGFFSRTQEVNRAVLIFRRDSAAAGWPTQPASAQARGVGGVGAAPEPVGTRQAELREGREARITLSAQRGEPPPQRANRPHSGVD